MQHTSPEYEPPHRLPAGVREAESAAFNEIIDIRDDSAEKAETQETFVNPDVIVMPETPERKNRLESLASRAGAIAMRALQRGGSSSWSGEGSERKSPDNQSKSGINID